MQATDSAGKCPTFNTEPNLDQARYIGKWYEHSKDIYNQFEWGAECGTAQYKTNAKTGFIDVRNRGWFWWAFFSYFPISGGARCETSGKCYVNLNPFDASPDLTKPVGNYNVLSTDYDNYSIVYSCSEPWYGGKTENVWILTRTNTIADLTSN